MLITCMYMYLTISIQYISTGLKPGKYESFLSLRGLARFTECCLVLWRLTGKQLHRMEAIKVTDMPDELSFSVLKLHYTSGRLCFMEVS